VKPPPPPGYHTRATLAGGPWATNDRPGRCAAVLAVLPGTHEDVALALGVDVRVVEWTLRDLLGAGRIEVAERRRSADGRRVVPVWRAKEGGQ
jgi:hypothetical protein